MAGKTDTPKKQSSALFVVLVLAIILVCGLIWAIARGRGGEADPDAAGARIASRHCQQAALDRLESPASARFAPISEQQIFRIEGPGKAYRVMSYVDAPARMNYTCDLHYDAASNTWSMDDFTFY
jgi:hypothetical protein